MDYMKEENRTGLGYSLKYHLATHRMMPSGRYSAACGMRGNPVTTTNEVLVSCKRCQKVIAEKEEQRRRYAEARRKIDQSRRFDGKTKT